MATIKKNTEAPSDKSWYEALKVKSDNSMFNALNSLPEKLSSEVGYENLLTGPINKVQRARILIARNNPAFEKVIEEGIVEARQTTLTNRDNISQVEIARAKKGLSTNNVEESQDPPIIRLNRTRTRFDSKADGDPSTSQLKQQTSKQFNNRISIINTSVSPYIAIQIQGMPTEVEVNPETTWAVIKSPGKNGAFYNYIGSEDSITLEISWYATHESREDVITKCKLLESWSKANGDFSSPPRLEIAWGSSGIFESQKFNLQSARYKLSNFQNSAKYQGQVVDLKLLPNTATQTLVFKRITTSVIRHEDIISSAKVNQFANYGITQG